MLIPTISKLCFTGHDHIIFGRFVPILPIYSYFYLFSWQNPWPLLFALRRWEPNPSLCLLQLLSSVYPRHFLCSYLHFPLFFGTNIYVFTFPGFDVKENMFLFWLCPPITCKFLGLYFNSNSCISFHIFCFYRPFLPTVQSIRPSLSTSLIISPVSFS